MSAGRGLRGFSPHFHRNRQHTGGTSRFDSRGRAVARSNRPHRQPSHRRACVFWHDSLHWRGKWKQEIQPLKRTDSGYPAGDPAAVGWSGLPLNPRLKTRIYPRNLYHSSNVRPTSFRRRTGACVDRKRSCEARKPPFCTDNGFTCLCTSPPSGRSYETRNSERDSGPTAAAFSQASRLPSSRNPGPPTVFRERLRGSVDSGLPAANRRTQTRRGGTVRR